MLNLKKLLTKVLDLLYHPFMAVSYSYEYTVNASGNLNVTATQMGFSTPTGYVPIGLLSWNTNSNAVIPRSMAMAATGGSSFCVLHNLSTSAVSAIMQARILYVKTELGGGTA